MEFEVTTLMDPKPWLTKATEKAPGAMVGHVRVKPTPSLEMSPELATFLWNGVTCTVVTQNDEFTVYEVSVPSWCEMTNLLGQADIETNRLSFEEVVQEFFRRLAHFIS